MTLFYPFLTFFVTWTATKRMIFKLTFIVWSPQSSPIKQKMISASSKDALKKKLDGCQVEWQLTDQSELEVKDRVDDLKDLP